jgi:hypothetical protein
MILKNDTKRLPQATPKRSHNWGKKSNLCARQSGCVTFPCPVSYPSVFLTG